MIDQTDSSLAPLYFYCYLFKKKNKIKSLFSGNTQSTRSRNDRSNSYAYYKFTCSKSTTETLEKDVKHVQS